VTATIVLSLSAATPRRLGTGQRTTAVACHDPPRSQGLTAPHHLRTGDGRTIDRVLAVPYRPTEPVRPRILEGWRGKALLAALAIGVVATLSACKNSDYCCSSAEGCALAKADGFGDGSLTPCSDPARPFCDDFGLYGAQNACIAEPSDSKCNGDEQCLDSAPFCVDQVCRACRDAANCDAEAPVCTAAYECGGCQTEADCAVYSPATPHCGDGGSCVACRTNEDCSGTTPICGGPSAACVACTSDQQCDSQVCLESSGACRPASSTLYVAPGGSDLGMCTQQAPCASLARAAALVTATQNFILMSPGAYGGSDSSAIVISGAVPFTISGSGASLTRASAGRVLEVLGATTQVTIEALRIHGATGVNGDGIFCDAQATITLRGVTVQSNAGKGLLALTCTVTMEGSSFSGNVGGGASTSGGTVTMEGSSFSGNAGGGASTSGGTVVIRNSSFAGNGRTGAGASLFGAISMTTPGAGSVVDFCTVMDNLAGGVNAAGVACTTVEGTVPVSNSIVVGASSSQIGAACGPRYVLSNQDLTAVGTGNIVGTPTFVDGFHLAATSEGVDDADPAATLNIDFDGDVRPQPTGGRRDIGADEVRR
jgi:hypothetical protein